MMNSKTAILFLWTWLAGGGIAAAEIPPNSLAAVTSVDSLVAPTARLAIDATASTYTLDTACDRMSTLRFTIHIVNRGSKPSPASSNPQALVVSIPSYGVSAHASLPEVPAAGAVDVTVQMPGTVHYGKFGVVISLSAGKSIPETSDTTVRVEVEFSPPHSTMEGAHSAGEKRMPHPHDTPTPVPTPSPIPTACPTRSITEPLVAHGSTAPIVPAHAPILAPGAPKI